ERVPALRPKRTFLQRREQAPRSAVAGARGRALGPISAPAEPAHPSPTATRVRSAHPSLIALPHKGGGKKAESASSSGATHSAPPAPLAGEGFQPWRRREQSDRDA